MRLKWRVLAAAIAGLLAMVLLYQRQKELEQRAFGGERIQVLVAKSNLRVGTRVQEKDVESMGVPELYVHPKSIRASDAGQVLGRPLALEVNSGQMIQWSDFGSTDRDKSGHAVPKGLRGTAIAVNEFIGKSGLVGPGERVDVLATFGGGSGEMKASITVTLLQNVPLIEINHNIAMLALELEEAELVTFAGAHGTVSLLLRNAEDIDVKKDVPPKSFKSLIDRVRELEQIQLSSGGDKNAQTGLVPPQKRGAGKPR